MLNRRTLLMGAGLAVAGGGGYVYGAGEGDAVRDRLRGDDGTNEAVDVSGGVVPGTGISRVDLEALAYANGTLTLTFASSDWDGWAISHAELDPVDDPIVNGEIPDFGEPIALPFDSLVADERQTFPSPEFTIMLLNGEFGSWDSGVAVILERGASLDFELPDTVVQNE